MLVRIVYARKSTPYLLPGVFQPPRSARAGTSADSHIDLAPINLTLLSECVYEGRLSPDPRKVPVCASFSSRLLSPHSPSAPFRLPPLPRRLIVQLRTLICRAGCAGRLYSIRR